MAKSRTITGFGATKLSLSGTSSENGEFIRFGPFFGPNMSAFSSFADAATSQAAVLEACISTQSTAMIVDLINFGDLTTDASASTTKFGPKNSTLAGSSQMFNYVRITTTALASTGTMSLNIWFASVDGGR